MSGGNLFFILFHVFNVVKNNVNNENCDGDNLNADKNIKCK